MAHASTLPLGSPPVNSYVWMVKAPNRDNTSPGTILVTRSCLGCDPRPNPPVFPLLHPLYESKKTVQHLRPHILLPFRLGFVSGGLTVGGFNCRISKLRNEDLLLGNSTPFSVLVVVAQLTAFLLYIVLNKSREGCNKVPAFSSPLPLLSHHHHHHHRFLLLERGDDDDVIIMKVMPSRKD